jgi:predicted lipoprotein with Yx(FWY)xxD motif
MKQITICGALLILSLLFVACGPAAAPVSTQIGERTMEPTQTEATESPVATEPPVATASPAVTGTSTAEATEAVGVPVTGQETVVRASLSDTYGPILTDEDGTALYLFMNDTQNGNASACTDEECVAEWPPFTTEGSPVAGGGAIQGLLGTITREDGITQVTYNGWPLYYFAGGSTSGQGEENLWFLVSPSGEAIQE